MASTAAGMFGLHTDSFRLDPIFAARLRARAMTRFVRNHFFNRARICF